MGIWEYTGELNKILTNIIRSPILDFNLIMPQLIDAVFMRYRKYQVVGGTKVCLVDC